MSARRRVRRRIQPYTWLGVGAVTIGMGAAMAGGTAVAFADTDADSGASASASAAGNSPAAADAPKRAARTGRGGATQADGGGRAQVTTAPVVDEVPAVEAAIPDMADLAPEVETAVAVPAAQARNSHNPAPAAAAPAEQVVNTAAQAAATPEADNIAQVTPDPAAAQDDSSAAVDPAPAAAVAAAAVSDDPAPSMESWLPATPIVPGAKVKLALQQIEQSQSLLTEETWGAGNILAGLGVFGPQAALATSQLMLAVWASSIGNAQDFVRNTVGNPLIHGIAQANLQNQLAWPALSDLSLATAAALITPLGWFGADVAESQALVAEARQNGKIYARVPIRVVLGTQPVVDAKIAGGRNATLLVDTGASGLVTTRDKVNAANLGPKVGSGNSCFSGNLCYHYETYNTTVDLGDGAVATAPVNIVANNADYPDSEAQFKQFFSWGADGILGLGANTAGPGPAPIPTAAMPGELSDGVLIHQNAYPLGLGGYMILGPNLYPTKASLPGAPDAYVKVSVNGGAKQNAAAIIDSGGVYGTLNRSLYPGGGVGTYVPADTKIDVYTADGATLLYSYTTKAGDAGTPYINSGLFNTGNAPYDQNPIYLNYGATPYGIGSTDFSIW